MQYEVRQCRWAAKSTVFLRRQLFAGRGGWFYDIPRTKVEIPLPHSRILLTRRMVNY